MSPSSEEQCLLHILGREETDGRLCVCKCSVRNCKEGIVCLKNLSFFPLAKRKIFSKKSKEGEKGEGNLSRV